MCANLAPAGPADVAASRTPLRRSLLFGGLAALGMAALYVGVVTLAQGWRDAVALFRQDLPLTAPIIAGFGTQVGLYVSFRGLARALAGGARAMAGTRVMVGTGGGTSAASMVACCAHRVADFLPIVGASAAASFLAAYKTPFMAIGLASNAAGIVIILRKKMLLGRHVSPQPAGRQATEAQP